MPTLLLVSENKKTFADFEKCLKNFENLDILSADTLTMAFDEMANNTVDLMVADEDVSGVKGLDIIEKMVTTYPMTNYAVVSSLKSDDFHEESEGLGVLMQLTPKPDIKQCRELMEQLYKVLALSSGIKKA